MFIFLIFLILYFSHAMSPTPEVSLSVITIKTQQRLHELCVVWVYNSHWQKRGVYSLDSMTQRCSGRRRVQQRDWWRVNKLVRLCWVSFRMWALISEGRTVTGTKPSHRKLYIQRFDVWDVDLSWDPPDAQLITACRFSVQAQEGTAVTSVKKRPLFSQL